MIQLSLNALGITPEDAKEDKQRFFFSMPKITEVEYSRTFRKQPPKMQRLSRRFREGGGRLQESNHRGPLSDVRVGLLYGG